LKLVRATEVLKVLVKVTVCAALVVPGALVKLSEVGENKRVPTLPVPVSVTVWVWLGALSTRVRMPVRVPWASGLNWTDTVQLALTASVDGAVGQVVEDTIKSDPVMLIPEKVSGADWLFVTVTALTPELWPTATAPHDREVGERLTVPVLAVATPER
jgi:hypothetical protein